MSDVNISNDQEVNSRLANNNDQLLLELNDVYSFVRESETTRTISKKTLSDFIAEAISEIKGPTTSGRPSKLERLDKIEKSLNDIVSALS